MIVRPYARQDGARVVEFLRAAAKDDATLVPVTPVGWGEFVEESWNLSGRDFAFAVEDDGATAGLLISSPIDDGAGRRLRHFRIFVDPARRRRGAATVLLRHVEAQDTAGPVIDQCNCQGGWSAGRAFLTRHGFACEATSLEMERRGGAPAPVEAPSGVRIRPHDGSPRDDAAWIALSEEGYRGTPGYAPMTAGDVALQRARPGSRVFVAEETRPGGAVVGLCQTVMWQGVEPWINSVVVVPSARGRGLGRALTVAGLRAVAADGHDRVRLDVRGDNEPARRIYDAVGFRVTDEVSTFRRHRLAAGPRA